MNASRRSAYALSDPTRKASTPAIALVCPLPERIIWP